MKRSRAANFTTAELMHLLELVDKYSIIENKKTDAATTREKQEAWRALTMEYNSTTSAGLRTMENLISCYKNQKIKVKKQFSNAKMSLPVLLPLTAEPGPSHSDKISMVVDAVTINGQDWDSVSETTSIPSQDCKAIFKKLTEEVKKQDSKFIKEMKCTGGGPPPQPPNDQVLDKVKSLIGPSLEGLYTRYDGDFQFMRQQQELLPPEKRLEPVDNLTPVKIQYDCKIQQTSNFTEGVPEQLPNSPISRKESGDQLSYTIIPKRLEVLKKRVDPSLEVHGNNKARKKNMSESYLELAEDKKCLVNIKKVLAENQLQNQQEIHQIHMETLKEKQKHERLKNKMEENFLKDKYELELNILKKKYMES